ncbi:hypothetical protein UY3_04795 [Chelonia mydas]|uniref:Uncharacterized protein n=1 Tax=Chelonia mydas TaxID=8469 RepID=M7BJD2_CHEMY|nr:hypothetical protein UY3_04795 [Chelonia mydas]
MSVHADPPAPSTGQHRSPFTGHTKKARKTPSSQRHRSKPGTEARPMWGSPRSPRASGPPTQVEQSSPTHSAQASPDVWVLSTLEALQVAQDVMSMLVPGAPLMSAPCSRGKPLLGSPQSPPARKLQAETLRAKGYQVQTRTLIVGALGAWDPSNERVQNQSTLRLADVRHHELPHHQVSDVKSSIVDAKTNGSCNRILFQFSNLIAPRPYYNKNYYMALEGDGARAGVLLPLAEVHRLRLQPQAPASLTLALATALKWGCDQRWGPNPQFENCWFI